MTRDIDRPPVPEIDHDRLAADLVRHIRGRQAQPLFSKRLGYDSNVAYTWESGRRSPTASRFFAAAKQMGFAPDAPTARFVRREAVEPLDTPAGIAALLAVLVGDQAVGAVAARAGCSRHQITRWTSGVAEPRLPDLLRAIDGASLGLLDWVAEWLDPEELASVRPIWRSLRGARALARSSPWASAVLLALGLSAYRALPTHQPGWIAERLGIPADLEEGCIEVLCSAGLAYRSAGQVFAVPRPSVDLRESRPRTDLKAFWSRVALDRLEAGAPGLHTWNLFSVSLASYTRIEALQRLFYAELRGEVAASEGNETLALAVLHLVPLG